MLKLIAQAIDAGYCMRTPVHSELFGFEKGVFTGAARRHIGKIDKYGINTISSTQVIR